MYEIVNQTNYDLEEINLLKDYIDYLVKKERLDKAIFNIILVDNEKIHAINREYRHKDMETDVISFALEDCKDLEYQDFRLLGDIYISVDKAFSQAKEYEHSFKRELFFLATHGVLHLLGYDHMQEDEEKVMFTHQDELLNGYGIVK